METRRFGVDSQGISTYGLKNSGAKPLAKPAAAAFKPTPWKLPIAGQNGKQAD